LILLGMPATHARADLLIEGSPSPVNIAPGGTGTMNFLITSNSGDTLSQFTFELLITPNVGTTSQLQFTNSQSDPYTSSMYVFHGESLGADVSTPFWSLPLTTNYAGDSILGGDVDDGTGPTPGFVTIPSAAGGAHSYLGTVQFQAPSTAVLGDTFQISLLTGANTSFLDQNGNPLSLQSTSLGTVHIAAPVPEPSALMLMTSALGLVLGSRLRRNCGNLGDRR
jgi:hypothetical protein